MSYKDLIEGSMEYVIRYGVIQRLKDSRTFTTHDFTTALEDLLPFFSTDFLKTLKSDIVSIIPEQNQYNKRDWLDTLEEIDKILNKRNETLYDVSHTFENSSLFFENK